MKKFVLVFSAVGLATALAVASCGPTTGKATKTDHSTLSGPLPVDHPPIAKDKMTCKTCHQVAALKPGAGVQWTSAEDVPDAGPGGGNPPDAAPLTLAE